MKKLFALLLSVAMVASLFAGVAFAAAPTVTFNPVHNGRVNKDANLTITFDQAVQHIDDSAIVDADLAGMITLTKDNVAVPFTATINAGKTVITVDPTSNLDLNGTYVLSVLAGKFENVGNEVVAATSATFTINQEGKAITSLGFTGVSPVTSKVYESDNVIVVDVPTATVLTGLVPVPVASTGATVTPSIATNHTAPVTYTVSPQDGGASRNYTVLVKKNWYLNTNVSGTIGLNNTVVLSGSLTEAGSSNLTTTRYIVVQYRPVGTTAWVEAPGASEIAVTGLGYFNFPYTFTTAGDYRLAVLTHTGGIAFQQGSVDLAYNIGNIAGLNLGVSTPISSISWDGSDQIKIPLSIIKSHAGGLDQKLVWENSVPPAGSADYAVITATYNNVNVPITAGMVTTDPAQGTTTITFSRGGAALTGTLVLSVRDKSGNYSSTVNINVVARSTFNAKTTTSSATLYQGDAVTFTTNIYNASGANPIAAGEYATVHIAGPGIAYHDPVPVKMAGTSRAISYRLMDIGTITVTTTHYNATHHKLAEVVETFEVKGGVKSNVTSARVGDVVKLTATVTDKDGNPLNNAKVTFTARSGAPFVVRNPQTGNFPTNPALSDGVNSVTVEGFVMTQPAGNAVANGVYTAEVYIVDAASVDIKVETWNSSINNWATWLDWSPANPAGEEATAMIIRPKLYDVTIGQPNLVTNYTETLSFTVKDANGALVTDNLGSIALYNLTAATSSGITYSPVQIAPGVWSGSFTSTYAGTIRVRMADSTGRNGVEFRVEVANPTVEVSTSKTAVTSDYYEVITVKMIDPRTNEPIKLPLQIREGRVRTPERLWVPTADLQVATRANANAPWVVQALTNDGGFMVYNFAAATEHEFRVLTKSRKYEIGGVEQSAAIRYMGGLSQLFAQTVTKATVEATPATLNVDKNNTVTVKVLDAHGNPIGTIPAGANAKVTRTINLTGMGLSMTHEIPEDGVSTFVIKPTASGLITGNVVVTASNDTAWAGNPSAPVNQVEKKVPVTTQADSTGPTITHNAPATVNAATFNLVVTVKDESKVKGIIFNGTEIVMFPSATHMFARTVNLQHGRNEFVVMAMDDSSENNVTVETIVIERVAPVVITLGKANPAIGLDVAATAKSGRTMLPFRWFGEQILGASVDYRVEGAAEIVTLVKDGKTVELTLNSTIAKVDGVAVALDVAAYATGGRTLVPARFLAETFGYSINWDSVTNNVTISK